jgi:hypothetical protein
LGRIYQISGIMVETHQATESITLSRRQLRYTVKKPWPSSWTAAVAQHFLMSAAARTLSLVDLCDLSEDVAHKDALWDAVARHRRRPGLPPLQLRSRLYLPVSACVQMQGLPSAVFSDQRDLARLPEASVSDPAHSLQSVRQRRQGTEQPSVEPQSGFACENRVRPVAQATLRFDIELSGDDFNRGR